MRTAFVAFFALLSFARPLCAQVDPQEAERLAKFKAVFLYNFIEYIKWPERKAAQPFTIGVLGQSDATPFLERILARRTINGAAIALRQGLTLADSLDDCHMLFVLPPYDKELGALRETVAGRHVVLVGDSAGAAARGASINFALVKGKLTFEISPQNLARAGLSMSSQLLKLGVLVE